MKPESTANPSVTDHLLSRRSAVGVLGAVGLASLATTAAGQGEKPAGATGFDPLAGTWDSAKGEYTLPALPYSYQALVPYLDAGTMEFHHDRHHQAYVTGANTALKELAKLRDSESPSGTQVKLWTNQLSFHLGGHINHTLFWQMMKPKDQGGGGNPKGLLSQKIIDDFGSHEKFGKVFRAAASSVEGSGWAWMGLDSISRKLVILQMEKQQDMLPPGIKPVLGIDMWEHAYYLTYQNVRADYITAFFEIVNWEFADQMYQLAMGK